MIKSYNSVADLRHKFMLSNCELNYKLIENKNSNVLISVPHAVSQVRLGKHKVAEIGSANIGLVLQDYTKSNFIIKTKNNFDDANFDEISLYKNEVYNIVNKLNIKYVLDIHGMRADRPIDINLGVNFGANVGADIVAFDKLNNMLIRNNFTVAVDQPFKAGVNTVSNFITKQRGTWSVQIEINCSITNKQEKFKDFVRLVDTLSQFITYLEERAVL